MADTGFVIGDSSLPLAIDTGSNTYNQRVNDKPVKRDLVINFRKPKQGESTRSRPARRKSKTEFHDQALSIIRDYLEAHPGSTKDRIYDHFINIVVRTEQIEEHNFEKLLMEVAYRRGRSRSTWFLRTD